MKKIVLVGAGGHCSSVIDTIMRNRDFNIVGITDNINIGKEILGVKIIGNDEVLEDLYKSGVKYAFITVGSVESTIIREKIALKLRKIGFILPAIVDKTAIIAKSVTLEEGVFVGKLAVLNTDVRIKENAIINTSAIVEHNCAIGKFTHISTNTTICGGSTIGDRTLVGAGSVVIQGINIGDEAIIGAGSVIIRGVDSESIVCGNPGRIIK